MKNRLICAISFVIFFHLTSTVYSQWVEIGPAGGWITCMKSMPDNPDKLFCGVLQGGAYVSDDRADHWQPIGEIGQGNPVYEISLSSGGVVAVASQQGLFISYDSGNHWQISIESPTWHVAVLTDSIIAAFTNFTDKSAVQTDQQAQRPWQISFDAGQSWQAWKGTEADYYSSPNSYILPFKKRGNIIHYHNCMFRSEKTKIYRTINDSLTQWQQVTDLISPYSESMAYLYPSATDSICYAFAEYVDLHPLGEYNGGIFKSKNDWQTWIKLPNLKSVTALAEHDNDLFFGVSQGVDYNTASELHLYRLESDELLLIGQFGGDITAIDAARWQESELLVATESGIFKTTNRGRTWENSSNGIYRSNITGVQILNNDGIERICLSIHKGGIWTSDDDGDTWNCTVQTSYVLPGLLQACRDHSQYLYAAGFQIMTSSNFGNSWYSIDPFSIPVAYYDWYGRTVHVAVDPSTPEHAIIHFDSHSLDDYRGITSIETYDTGISWNIRQPEEGSVRSIKAVFDNHRLWLSYKNYDAEILSRPALIAFDVTTNDTICSVTLPDSVSADFWCVNGDTCYVINSETGQYYRSNDRGMTWSITQLELNEYPRYWQDWAVNEEFGQLILAPDHQSLFFIYPGTGLIYSPDNGYSWEDLNGNLPTLNLYQLAYSTDRPYIIYVATDNGLFKRDYTTGIDWDGNKITQTDTKSSFQDFHLLNNYPNPFNPSTTIRYDLPHPGHVSLNIYNIRGQLIAALLDEHKPAGSHTAQWDSRAQAGAAASGVYYCRLTFTGDDGVEQVLTRKMVVVK